MKKLVVTVAAIILLTSLFTIVGSTRALAPAGSESNSSQASAQAQDNVILLVTSMGNITIELFTDMPITSGNFKNLTEHGIYDGTTFHRVAHDFVIQGGDATSKGIIVPTIPDELPNKHNNIRGSVGMAKTIQPNSATSQFYINLENNTFLDSDYTVFGRVIAGMNVVDNIGAVQTNPPDDGEPLVTITINTARIVPEYSQPMFLAFLAGLTLLIVVLSRKKIIQRTRSQFKDLA